MIWQQSIGIHHDAHRRGHRSGTGVLGSQIAYQTAYSGLDVVAYDINEKALTAAKKRFTRLAATYKEQIKGAAEGKADAALKRITLQTDLGLAVAEPDLVIEAIPENVELKRDIYRKIGHLAPEKTIFATNTSTLLPNDLMGSTCWPERFLSLHFANQIWIHNTAEVMGTQQDGPGRLSHDRRVCLRDDLKTTHFASFASCFISYF